MIMSGDLKKYIADDIGDITQLKKSAVEKVISIVNVSLWLMNVMKCKIDWTGKKINYLFIDRNSMPSVIKIANH